MSRDFVYELILTPEETYSIVEALNSRDAETLTPFESEGFEYAKAKVNALWEYIQADRASNEAEKLYKETLEKDRDAFKVEAF